LPDLAALLESWQLVMRSEHKSEETVKSYTAGVTGFLRWCDTSGTPPELTKTAVQAYIAHVLDGGAQPATARARQTGLKRFAAWLSDEDEIGTDPLLGVKAPKLDTKVTESLTDDELRRLIKTCQGKSLRDRRDEAIVRLMAETGMRAGELLALRVDDVDLARGLATVRRGKGAKGRVAPFGAQTTAVIDRYLRARRTARIPDGGALWVGAGGAKTFGYHGLDKSLRDRAKTAGINGFHLHLMRHTAATRWLRHGGSEGGLMAIAGWSTRDMIDRYTGASAAERAAAEARKLGLGDL
jgi:site-specific recombinase XerD